MARFTVQIRSALTTSNPTRQDRSQIAKRRTTPTYSSPDTVVSRSRIKSGKSTAGTKNVSTLTKGNKTSYLTVGGTPTISRPTKIAKARSEAKTVKRSLARVREAYSKPGGVSGPGIDAGESKFYSTVAKKTGLSPRVLAAQGTQEGGADGDYNILNIGHTDSGSLGLTTDSRFKKPKSAAKVTANFFKGKEFGASEGIQNITKSAGKPEAEQVKAIADSGWATDPNYHRGISSILPSIKSKPGAKPAKKDLKTLRKAGVSPKPSTKKPFAPAAKKAASAENAAKLIAPKWAPEKDFGTGAHGETILAKGISPVVKKWAKKYDVDVGEAKADSGHVSPGHLTTGTATDLYPKQNTEAGWDELEKGLKVLEAQGFEVGYGTNGVGQAWSNHGRNNHAHVEWVGQGSSTDAIQKLAGLTDAEIAAIESGAGGGGAVSSSGGTSSGGTSSGGSTSGGSSASSGTGGKSGTKADKQAEMKRKLRRVQGAYNTTSTTESGSSLSALERRYGSPRV